VCVCVLIKRENLSFFLAHIIILRYCICVTLFFLFFLLLLCSRLKKKSFKKQNTLVSYSQEKSAHSSLSLFCFFRLFHFFCIAIHVSLFFLPYLQTIHLNVRLSLRNRQKEKQRFIVYLLFMIDHIFQIKCQWEKIFMKNINYFQNV